MAEKTPDTDRSGIDRRNVLKGLGFTALGGGALAERVAAQDGGEPDGRMDRIESSCDSGLIDFAHLVPAGADPDEPQGTYDDSPDGAMDLVFQLDTPGMEQSSSKAIAYQVAFVSEGEEGNNAATRPVEDGRTRGFAGTVQAAPGGETQRREEFSTSGLGGSDGSTYWVVLMVADYSGLPDSLPIDAGVIRVQIN